MFNEGRDSQNLGSGRRSGTQEPLRGGGDGQSHRDFGLKQNEGISQEACVEKGGKQKTLVLMCSGYRSQIIYDLPLIRFA